MPDIDSRKLTGSENNLPEMRLDSNVPLIRRWTCPDNDTIASYVDNGLSATQKARVGLHLSKCTSCRAIVADIVKLQREADLPVPPIQLTRRTVQFAPAISARSGWMWAPAAAMVLIGLLTVILILLREPQKFVVSSPATPSAPMVAKVEPPISGNAPSREILRKPMLSETRPVILSPRPESFVGRGQLEFNWTPVSHSRYYQISVVTSDGDLLWEGQTDKSVLHFPSEVALKRGKYFVWVTAYMADGRVEKSSPVQFVVKG
jgi:hypothetical protein